MLWNSFLLAIKGIRRNLMRSFLTILGIVIGVAAVITMVTLGNGATQAVKDQVSSMGSNLLMIRPGTRMRGPRGAGTPDFSMDDVKAIREQVSGLAAVAPQVTSRPPRLRQRTESRQVPPPVELISRSTPPSPVIFGLPAISHTASLISWDR